MLFSSYLLSPYSFSNFLLTFTIFLNLSSFPFFIHFSFSFYPSQSCFLLFSPYILSPYSASNFLLTVTILISSFLFFIIFFFLSFSVFFLATTPTSFFPSSWLFLLMPFHSLILLFFLAPFNYSSLSPSLLLIFLFYSLSCLPLPSTWLLLFLLIPFHSLILLFLPCSL